MVVTVAAPKLAVFTLVITGLERLFAAICGGRARNRCGVLSQLDGFDMASCV